MMKHRSRILSAIAVAVPLTLLAAACSGGEAGPEGPAAENPSSEAEALGGEENAQRLQELYDAAVEDGENTVVVYGTVTNDRLAVFDRFTEMYPEIEVKTEFLTGSNLFSVVNQEVASGNHIGDLILTGDTSMVALAEAGRLADFLPPATEELADEYVDDQGRFATMTVTPFGVAYNTESYEGSEVPQDWADVVDPQYEGELAWVDLTGMGPSLVPTSRLLSAGVIDEEWLRDLKAQNVHFEGRASALSGVLASGERSILISYPYDYFVTDRDKGVPIGFRLMDSNNYVATNGGGVLVDAPHPNAAKLLFSWLYTPAAQEVLTEVGQYSPMPGAASPEGLPPLDEIPTVEPAPWDELSANNKKALELTQQVFR